MRIYNRFRKYRLLLSSCTASEKKFVVKRIGLLNGIPSIGLFFLLSIENEKNISTFCCIIIPDLIMSSLCFLYLYVIPEHEIHHKNIEIGPRVK